MIELPNKSPEVLEKFFKENLSVVYRYIVKTIITAIKKDIPRVNLFKYATGHIVYAKKENYISDIEHALQIFIRTEDYEAAKVTRSFLDGYYIDQLIKETSKQ